MTVDALDNLVDEIDDITNPDGGTTQEPAQAAAPPQDNPASQLQPEEAQDLDIPAHWPEADRKMLANMPPEARDFIVRRHKEMEGDYTRKTTLVSEQAKALAGLQGLAVHLQRDPDFRAHLQGYFSGKAQAQAQAQTPQQEGGQPQGGEEELTPVEQLKHEAADLAYQRIRREEEARSAQMAQMSHQQKIQAVLMMKEEDELAPKVQEKLNKYVEAQPLRWQRESMYETLATNPDVYAQMYQHYRKEVEAELAQDPLGESVGNQPTGGRTNVVRLERGGGDRRPTVNDAKRKQISKLKHQALASGNTDALANFLDEAGVIESLL